jgi:hypothetical protein
MPMVRWDPFMYWAIAEGGAQFGTAMPAFKDTLSSDGIWAVIAYVRQVTRHWHPAIISAFKRAIVCLIVESPSFAKLLCSATKSQRNTS